MKTTLLIFTFLAFISINCRHEKILSFTNDKQDQVIALQPLDGYEVQNIQTVINDINRFYNRKIIILNSINIGI